jgi:hypothetical protein
MGPRAVKVPISAENRAQPPSTGPSVRAGRRPRR